MPVLDDVRGTKEIVLPKTGGKVVIYDSFIYGDVYKLQGAESNPDKQIELAISIIKEWDFTDKDDKKLPIIKENFLKLPAEDVAELVKNLGSFGTDKKKESQPKE